ILLATRLNEIWPLIVVVLAVAVAISTVTVSPARIVTESVATGTLAGSHVAALDQLPDPFDVSAALVEDAQKNTKAANKKYGAHPAPPVRRFFRGESTHAYKGG